MENPFSRETLITGFLSGFLATFLFIASNALLRGASGASPAITALYGLPTTQAATVAVHLLNGSLMGVFYSVFFEKAPRETSYIEEIVVAGGLIYGVFTTVFFASIVMPVWLNLVGFSESINILNIKPMSIATHMIYGAALAAFYRPVKQKITDLTN